MNATLNLISLKRINTIPSSDVGNARSYMYDICYVKWYVRDGIMSFNYALSEESRFGDKVIVTMTQPTSNDGVVRSTTVQAQVRKDGKSIWKSL